MADIDYTHGVYFPDSDGQNADVQDRHMAQGEPAIGPSSLGAAASVVGAMASFALVIGVGVWGYKLMVRDVSGVPVVRALEGPMRIQPKNPGGQQADHQGLAVNAVAADGTAEPTADRLMLAPRPVDLADEDMPLGQIASQTETKPETATVDAVKFDLQAMTVDELVEQLTAGVEPISGSPIDRASPTPSVALDGQSEILATDTPATEEVAVVEPSQPEEPVVVLAVLTGPGLTRSLRPQSRPARVVGPETDQSVDPVLASAINAAVDTVANLEIDPANVPVGTRLAQLGAYDSAEIARAEWDKLNLRFEEYLEGKQRVIQKASSGGRTFYRLRAMGFDDLSSARRFCSALVSENTDCIPVTSR